MRFLGQRNTNTLLAVTAAIVLLVFLFSYSETGSPPALNNRPVSNLQPNFYLDNSFSRQFDADGVLDYSIDSKAVRHDPANDTIKLKTPLFRLYKEGHPQWNISANSGVVFAGGDKIDLRQQVLIISADELTSVKTPQLWVYPNGKKADTEKPVTLFSSNGFTRAIGLKADLNNKHITLLQQVRGQYEPEIINRDQ